MKDCMLKRMFDLFCSLFLLVCLAPVLLLIAVLIRVESSGPALLCQKRMGLNKKPFTCYKFRTMREETPDLATNELDDRDRYLTGLGVYLRKYSLDELPQLFNIIKGDMSLVGPRPVILQEKRLIKKRKEEGIYRLRPGVTGWAQINGRDEVGVKRKVKLDKYYLKNRSFFLDLKIIFRTAGYVLKREGVLEHNNESPEQKEGQENKVSREKS